MSRQEARQARRQDQAARMAAVDAGYVHGRVDLPPLPARQRRLGRLVALVVIAVALAATVYVFTRPHHPGEAGCGPGLRLSPSEGVCVPRVAR